jgi:hypothetical protein
VAVADAPGCSSHRSSSRCAPTRTSSRSSTRRSTCRCRSIARPAALRWSRCDPRERLRACIASGVPRAKHQIDTTRLLIELHPYVLRDPAQLERWHAYCAEQTATYRAVLEQGAAEQVFVLADTAERIGEDFIALEDGYSGSVIAGTRTADYVEERLWAFAKSMCAIT